MKYVRPDFYGQFHCTADRCQDTCCAGWAVVIDQDSVERYQADQTPLGARIRSHMTESHGEHVFEMLENGDCPFLNQRHLCDMILEGGEGMLCQICTDHPRFFAWYGEYEEAGIGLCCQEGSRLLLEQTTPLCLVETVDDQEGELDFDADVLYGLRQVLLEIVADPDLSWGEKMVEMLTMTQETQTALGGDAPGEQVVCDMAKLRKITLDAMAEMVPIHAGWSGFLQELIKDLPLILGKEQDFLFSKDFSKLQQENTVAYLLFRHFPNGLWDGDLTGRVKFAYLSADFVHLCNLQAWVHQGSLTLENQVEHLKNWSKQVEYCDENVTLFLDVCQQISPLSSWGEFGIM